VTRAVDAMCLARAERAEFADLLDTLTPDQWNAPSLCSGWRVRDVVAHMFSYEDLGVFGLVGRFLRGGLLPDRVNALGVAEYAEHSTDELLARVKDRLQPRGLTTGFGGRIALTDAMIHQQDIRRPLGLPRDIPAERLAVTLDFGRTAPPIGAAKRIRGLRLIATDLEWASGDGPEVRGTGEALLMAMAGRHCVVDELSGPGVATLASR
jgi:uncharacterized protein (TIGR03083 family)